MTLDYLHHASIGDEKACHAVQDRVREKMGAFYHADIIRGYLSSFIYDETRAEEEMIEPDVLEITKGRFPFLYLRVNYREERSEKAEVIAAVLAEGFVPME